MTISDALLIIGFVSGGLTVYWILWRIIERIEVRMDDARYRRDFEKWTKERNL